MNEKGAVGMMMVLQEREDNNIACCFIGKLRNSYTFYGVLPAILDCLRHHPPSWNIILKFKNPSAFKVQEIESNKMSLYI